MVLYLFTGWLILILMTWNPNDLSYFHSSNADLIQNKGGLLGAHLSNILLYFFGFSTWWYVILLLYFIWNIHFRLIFYIGFDFSKNFLNSKLEKLIGFVFLFCGSSGLEALRFYRFGENLPYSSKQMNGSGGALGQLIGHYLSDGIGFFESTLFLLIILGIGTSLVFSFSWLWVSEYIGFFIEKIFLIFFKFFIRNQQEKKNNFSKEFSNNEINIQFKENNKSYQECEKQSFQELTISNLNSNNAESFLKSFSNNTNNILLPNLDLLDLPLKRHNLISPHTIQHISKLIEKKLGDFGISVSVVNAQAGPVITCYEIAPSIGVKGSQIVALEKDLARVLSLASIRVVETIPGKNLMRLELPNSERQTVKIFEILSSKAYCDSESLVTIALGKDISGNAIVIDLLKMPHLLISGTTGSGKSVGIHAMILSLLYKSKPSDIRIILIDPKMLEMNIYKGIPHLLFPVITNVYQAENALNWCVHEMEKRYAIMSKLGVRNLSEYNIKVREKSDSKKIISGSLSHDNKKEQSNTLPIIIVIIDELADLMITVGKKVEELIARLAQKARASGIHLILATQRPSVDVITGLIKANIPARIAFKASSKIDSRTILDQVGAETLLGQGDMLYVSPGTCYPVRVHGAFVNNKEITRVVDFLKKQGEPNYIHNMLKNEFTRNVVN
ncbi:MAG: DNA translocase FtsK 4TM domain-containing protein [Bordetella sp.]|nr:MAG: DNA translocase FtsK 4TM domain-containing protein [Bordetella sp.]